PQCAKVKQINYLVWVSTLHVRIKLECLVHSHLFRHCVLREETQLFPSFTRASYVLAVKKNIAAKGLQNTRDCPKKSCLAHAVWPQNNVDRRLLQFKTNVIQYNLPIIPRRHVIQF